MSLKPSTALRNGLLQGSSVKEQLDGGFIFFFAGPVPADADVALDMAASHTQLAKITADAVAVDNGATGLTFAAAAANGAITKTLAETWHGLVNFVGKDAAQAGVSALTPTFYRHCKAGDNGQAIGDATTPRIQGTLGVSGADGLLSTATLFDDGVNVTGFATYEVRQPSGA